MVGRTNAGSGGGKACAAVRVEYPMNSICTCSNGTRTLKAKDTSGVYLFNVPETGVWRAAISPDGTSDKAYKDLELNLYDVESIKLAYETLLFKVENGTPVFSGFDAWNTAASRALNTQTGQAAPNISYSGSQMSIAPGYFYGSAPGVAYTGLIDVTDSASIDITYEQTGGSADNQLVVGVSTSIPNELSFWYDNRATLFADYVSTFSSEALTSGTLRLNVSNLSGSYRIWVCTTVPTFKISEIYKR